MVYWSRSKESEQCRDYWSIL